ncbi:hypothetical protein Nepgr_016477 [Nepenthes gracilis]|uniref:Uncharacterized protein n=1 Tax=Nepenthes gracilis TaxID=150966 RepID=A0AAD3SQF2_NEPGR|nr:hypothetical protein Nepgr_016477 [Nepenthes gracilis]
MTLLAATGHLDGMISSELPIPDGAEGVLSDDQSHLPVALVSSGLPDAHLKDLAGDFHGPLLGEAVFNQLVEKKLTFAACCWDLKLLLDEAAG